MTFLKQLGIGYNGYIKAVDLIIRKKLFVYFLIPLLLDILLLVVGIDLIFDLINYSVAWFKSFVNFDTKSFWGHQYLNDIFSYLITGSIYVLFFIAFFYISGYVIIMIMSPVLAHLSEKIDKILTGTDYPFSLKQMIKDIWRGLAIALRNMVIETIVLIAMLFVSLIPIIGFITPVVLFLVSSYFYGFSFIDFSNERKKRNISESVQWVRSHKWIAFSNGSVYSVSLLIPFCGSILAVFTTVLAVAAATISVADAETINKNHK